MADYWLTPIIALICITLILTLSIMQGFDGVLIGAGVVALAGIGGYTAGKNKKSV